MDSKCSVCGEMGRWYRYKNEFSGKMKLKRRKQWKKKNSRIFRAKEDSLCHNFTDKREKFDEEGC